MPNYRHFMPLVQMIPLTIGYNFKLMLNIIAKQLDHAEDDLMSALDERHPTTATQDTIIQWENELGITVPADSLAQRRIDAFIRNKGEALSTSADINSLAASLELEIIIHKRFPFIAGVSYCGDRLNLAGWKSRLIVEVINDTTSEVIEKYRLRMNEYLPATITGGIYYGDTLVNWR